MGVCSEDDIKLYLFDCVKFTERSTTTPRWTIPPHRTVRQDDTAKANNPKVIQSLPWTCSFDSGGSPTWCDFTQSVGDALDTELHRGGTPTVGTGPPADDATSMLKYTVLALVKITVLARAYAAAPPLGIFGQ